MVAEHEARFWVVVGMLLVTLWVPFNGLSLGFQLAACVGLLRFARYGRFSGGTGDAVGEPSLSP